MVQALDESGKRKWRIIIFVAGIVSFAISALYFGWTLETTNGGIWPFFMGAALVYLVTFKWSQQTALHRDWIYATILTYILSVLIFSGSGKTLLASLITLILFGDIVISYGLAAIKIGTTNIQTTDQLQMFPYSVIVFLLFVGWVYLEFFNQRQMPWLTILRRTILAALMLITLIGVIACSNANIGPIG